MNEELDSLFGKSKKKKMKGVIKLDDLAQTLDHNSKPGKNEDDLSTPRIIEPEHIINQEEDPEWRQYNPRPPLPGEMAGVFNYEEEVEQEYIAEERQQRAEQAKTWQKAEPEPTKEETPTVDPVPELPKTQPTVTSNPTPSSTPYIPPNLRAANQTSAAKRPVHKLDIGNEELFPSLGQAANVNKEEKQKDHQAQKQRPTESPSAVKQEVASEIPKMKTESVSIQDPIISKVSTPPPPESEASKTVTPRPRSGAREDRRPGHTYSVSRQEGPRGTGIFNAKGEEIMTTNNAPSDDLSWRRAAGHTVKEIRQVSPPLSDQPPQQQRRNHPPSAEKQEVKNWRDEARPVCAPSPPKQQHHQRQDHYPRQDRRRHDNRGAGHQQQVQPKSTAQHWRAEPSKTTQSPSAEEESGWHTVSGNRKNASHHPTTRGLHKDTRVHSNRRQN